MNGLESGEELIECKSKGKEIGDLGSDGSTAFSNGISN
jgi:hypothetical protein